MINFDNIDKEILENPNESKVLLIAEQAILDVEIDLAPFIQTAENFEVISKSTANLCLSMSLQARKMRYSLDKSRTEILKPHMNFVKAINKQAKQYEEKLDDLEKKLSDKLLIWLEKPEEFETTSLNVRDGSLSKKQIWDYQILNENILPSYMTKADPIKIKEFIKNYDGGLVPEGIRIFRKTEINLRVKNT